MANITHAITSTVGTDAMRASLTTLTGLNKWWTSQTTGDPSQGGILAFRFGDHGGPDMAVEKVTEEQVIWRCVSGPQEWIDTTIEFHFNGNDSGGTQLMFTHRGWASETPFHYHCSMKWASFLLSLKEYLELGAGRPFPDDIQIDGPVTGKVA